MPTVTSTDGTIIAYERTGSGPALVLVDGAMCYRAAGPMGPVAGLLQQQFTVYAYDRRGRGESADTVPFAVEREMEDLRAVIAVAGGEAGVYAMSSGGALALATAATGPGITALALYETPFLAEAGDDVGMKEYTARLHDLLDEDRRGDAVELFMTFVGVPAQAIQGMRTQPVWAAFEAIAPTLAYDDAVLAGGALPRDLASELTIPVLVIAGDASPEPLRRAAARTATAIPAAELRVLAGQTHDVAPDALAPVLIDFFGSLQRSAGPVDR
jgi:pimeloyl-ACP methyl ester carboxylesterase